MKNLLVAAGALLLVVACARETRPRRVITLAFDGLDPSTVDLLMSEGKLPHFAKLRRDGSYAPLVSAMPLKSPVIWTTVATGKTPDHHRIGDFATVNAATGEQIPVTSRTRATKAIWNILSDRARAVDVVGWWATWPAEKIRGVMVTDHLDYHFLFREALGTRPVESETVYPPEVAKEIAPLVKRPQDLTSADVAPYVSVPDSDLKRPIDLRDDLSLFRWALAAALTHRDVGLHLWKKNAPQQLMVYFEATDSTAHLFGHLFRAGKLAGDLAEQQRRYGNTVEQIYMLADRIVGDYLDVMDEDTVLMILSDHGFALGRLQDDPSVTRDLRRASERSHTLRGVLYLYGSGIKRGKIAGPSIVDIAPTLLALNDLPPAADMPGRVLAEALTFQPRPAIASYEGSAAGSQVAQAPRDPIVERETMQRLKSLGYLDSNTLAAERTVAGALFEQQKYAESADAYRKLVAAHPNDADLRSSLAGALGALGDYAGALKELDRAIAINPISPEAYHNRAVLHERRGERREAIADYESAVRYNPEYAPSLAALARLGVSALPNTPGNESERRARELAERASDAARRGDYVTAMRYLDDALALAPKYALLYQYRSNVAYLMGDRKGAIAALKKGLQIAPDNALFRENLKRLEGAAKD